MPTTTELLWRREAPQPIRPGRRPRFSVDDIVTAAIQMADRDGAGFGLRDVAASLGVGVMSLYSYVEDRRQLLELMVDECHREMRTSDMSGMDWAAGLRCLAKDNLALFRAHAWLTDQGGERAVLGPGTIAKYDRELDVLEALPISDLEKDACLALVLGFVTTAARSMAVADTECADETHAAWWAREGAVLARLDIDQRFPLAVRVGQAAGSHHGAAGDSAFAYRFGLDRLIVGIADLVAAPAQ